MAEARQIAVEYNESDEGKILVVTLVFCVLDFVLNIFIALLITGTIPGCVI